MFFRYYFFIFNTETKKMDNQERQAVISIEMDRQWNFEIRWDGDNMYRLPMMGALDFGKDYLKDQIRWGSAVSASETCRNEEKEYNTGNVQVVSKQEAISLYLDAFEKIQNRLTAIAWTDDRATYQVPEFIKTL